MTNRDSFARAALAQIPKILTLLDRNPHSPTYGCFDRTFWQYKVIDFPAGMSQEFVYPLALAYGCNLPGNIYYQQPMIKEWVKAGIEYAYLSSHGNGSCDDYFPYERAAGAAAFSLLACLESTTLLGLQHSESVLDFFSRRADWLAGHQESGRLTNHQALIVLCLELVGRLLKTDRWNKSKQERLAQVFSWQNPEGWFIEYEGCDPGYHTLTISCLARLYERQPTEKLRQAIARAVELAAEFVHPDGSYGGEYTSRNTYNFFPHGFELVGRWLPSALNINDRFLQGLANGLGSCYADDRIIGHHTWNYLLAWRDFVPVRPLLKPRPKGRVYLQQGGILIDRRDNTELYLALNKGGVFKLFRNGQLVASDTQFSVLVQDGKQRRNAVGHLVDRYQIGLEQDRIAIAGNLGWAKQKQMNPLNLIVLRLVMLSVGRFFPNLIRRTLQAILITGKKNTPFQFTRSVSWRDGSWQIDDSLTAESWHNVTAIDIGGDRTSIYVVMSRTFQPGQLQPAWDLSEQLASLHPGATLSFTRSL
ncbi:MAG: hypothetical protein AAFQ14_04830 [Cyanobacteria bacterium J06621_12]